MEFSGPPPDDTKKESTDESSVMEGLTRIKEQAERQSRLILGELFGQESEKQAETKPRTIRPLSVLRAGEPEQRYATPAERPIPPVIPRIVREPSPARTAESLPHSQERPLPPPEAPGTGQYAEAHVPPEIVMEQVAVAAEQDVPVEGLLELRNERKDEPGMPDHAVVAGAVSVGSILQDHQQYNPPYDMSSPSGPTTGQDTPAQDFGYPAARGYRSAMIKGFGVAVAVIAIALMAYLLF